MSLNKRTLRRIMLLFCAVDFEGFLNAFLVSPLTSTQFRLTNTGYLRGADEKFGNNWSHGIMPYTVLSSERELLSC